MDGPASDRSCVYTLMLNELGGIEADLTVARTGEDEFYLTTAGPVVKYVIRYMNK